MDAKKNLAKGALMQTSFACGHGYAPTPLDTVAIYRLSVKTISRSVGRSATAAAAYRAGVKRKKDQA